MTDQGNTGREKPRDAGTGSPVDPGYLSEIRGFYDQLAPEYDRMTDFQTRLDRDGPVFDALTRRFGVRRALDAGCGTGFHSILLARAGVEVTAIDLSPEMVRCAEQNAARAGVTVRACRSSLSDLAWLRSKPFDALFCLGNTLAHLRDDAALDDALRNFRMVIRPGGTLVVQVLNYEKILALREEVLNVRKVGDTTFERKYTYGEGSITFTLSMTRPEGARSRSVILRPITRPVLLDALRRCGFQHPRTAGNLSLEAYAPETSPDLVVVATG